MPARQRKTPPSEAPPVVESTSEVRVVTGEIGFTHEVPTNEVKDSWEKKFGGITVTYSTEGVLGSGYIHNCQIDRTNWTTETSTATSTQTSGRRLTREEIEKLPRLAEFPSTYLS